MSELSEGLDEAGRGIDALLAEIASANARIQELEAQERALQRYADALDAAIEVLHIAEESSDE